MMSEAVRLYLARDSYLRGLTDSALSERLVHWVNNCTQLSSSGMVLLCATENPDFFHRLLDVISETALRHGDVSAAQDRSMWDTSRNVMINPGQETTEKINRLSHFLQPNGPPFLLRFGSRSNMQELVASGGLLFQEASTFGNAENLSVQDDELTLLMKRYIPTNELHHILETPVPTPFEGPGMGLNFALSCPNFLVLCMTDTINFRMISDWNAEAVAVIHDPLEFKRRLKDVTADLISGAGAKQLEGGKVRYIDPYFPLSRPDVPFCKHYKFAYQREYRFVIRGPKRVTFAQRKLALGPLKDIATFVDLT